MDDTSKVAKHNNRVFVYAELGIHQADQTKPTNQPLAGKTFAVQTTTTQTVRYPP
jgi:hypothetical protein